MKKSNIILKTLSILTGIAIIGIGGLSFLLTSEMNIILKLLILLLGVSILLVLILLGQIAEGIISVAEEYKNGAQLRKENGGYIKDSMEILEAINVVELKKNKSVKDIADILAEAAPMLKEKSTVGVSTEKIEQLLTEISENIKNVGLKNEHTVTEVKIEQLKEEEVEPVVVEKPLEKIDFYEEEIDGTVEKKEIFQEAAFEEVKAENVEENNVLTENIEKIEENMGTALEEEIEKKQLSDKYELPIENEFGIDEEEEIETENLSEEIEESSVNIETQNIDIQPVVEESENLEKIIEKNIENNEKTELLEESEEKAGVKVENSIKIMSASDYFEEEENVKYSSIPEKKEIKNELLFGLMAEEAVPKKEKKNVYFSDVRLEELIRDMIDKPSGNITEDEIVDITELKAGNRGIKKLDGIENLVNLEELDLWKAEISDISLLANLKRLVYLRLSKTGVKDLTPLKELKNLEELYLQEIPATDLTPVGELKSLKMLYLEKTKFDSLEPLLLIPDLQELYLWGADISSETNKIVMKKLEEKGCRITK